MKIFTEKPETENLRELLEFCSECAETLTMITLRLTVLEKRLSKLENKAE